MITSWALNTDRHNFKQLLFLFPGHFLTNKVKTVTIKDSVRLKSVALDSKPLLDEIKSFMNAVARENSAGSSPNARE